MKLFKRSGGRGVDHGRNNADANNNADAETRVSDDRKVDNGTTKSVSDSDNGIKGGARDRRNHSRALNPARLFDDDATTTLRLQLTNLAADLERSRSAEVVASQRAKHLAASFAEVRLTLATFVPEPVPPTNPTDPTNPSKPPTPTPTPTPTVADPSPTVAETPQGERRSRPRAAEDAYLLDDDATTALRVQLAALAVELESSRSAEVLASQQADILAASLASIKATIDGLGSLSHGRASSSAARSGSKSLKPPVRRRRKR